ncbi:MAG: hypothetical protein ACOX2U_07595 [Limisphaerales bacterium]|jgi:protein-tyrosine-phosphatase
MAEELFRMETSDLKGIVAESAGTATEEGFPPSMNAVLAMLELGRDISQLRSSQMSEEKVSQADLIFTMTSAHLQIAQGCYPDAASKMLILKPECDIFDPYGADLDTYRRCRDQIRESIRERLPALREFLK